MRSKNESLLDVIVSNHRIVVSSDLYNWIIKFGSANVNDKVFSKNAHSWYFCDIANMLTYVHKILLRLKLRSLDLTDVLDAIKHSDKEIQEIGKALDEKLGMENGCK